jgi:hypothetical protein
MVANIGAPDRRRNKPVLVKQMPEIARGKAALL